MLYFLTMYDYIGDERGFQIDAVTFFCQSEELK